MWTKQRTKQGDTLSSLARAYGTTIEKILAANSIEVRPSDRYLSQQAQAYMLPTNLPRAKLAKLVRERDIHKWVRSIGGECDAIREGSQTQTLRLLTCAPGAYCRFTADTAINLPMRARLAGLGAVASSDVAVLVRGIPAKAQVMADAVVGTIKTQAEKAWRDTFLEQVQQLTTAALKKRPDGRFNFEADKTFVARIMSFIEKGVAEAEQEFSFAASVRRVVDDNVRAVRAVLDSISAPAPALPAPTTPAKADKKPAPAQFRPTAATLDAVRRGQASLSRGQSGPAVRELQTLLLVSADSLFGAQTEAALKQVQTDKGLPVTGVLDSATLQAIEAPTSAPVTMQVAKDNTMLYVGVGVGAVLVVAALARKRRKAA